jgi:L-fuconolactonase
MIIDSHTHAWEHWPYQPPVPDPRSRGTIEQLLFEMDNNGVDEAVLVCANIDHNPHNNAYIARCVQQYPNRFHHFADVDSAWSTTYHTGGAAVRLRNVAKQYPLKGFTHYLKPEDDGRWLYSSEGLEFFKVAARLNLIASLSSYPHQQAAIRNVAEQYPELPILLHHLGHPKVGKKEDLATILESAKFSNIYLKLSGFYYATSGEQWDFPYRDVQEIVMALYDGFGPRRLCWGSDYPVVKQFMTYRQALESFRNYCTSIPTKEHSFILGHNLAHLLASAHVI